MARGVRESLGALLDYHEQRMVRELHSIRRDFHAATAANEVRSREAIARFASLATQTEHLLKSTGTVLPQAPIAPLAPDEIAQWRAFLVRRDKTRSERQKMIASRLSGRRHVLDLDATDGSLLQLLAPLGITGMGLTDTPSIAVDARASGLDLRVQLLDEVVRGMQTDEFDAVVIDRLSDRLDDNELRALLDALYGKLPKGGVVLISARNPIAPGAASLITGEHVRHPDFLEFLLGTRFSHVEIIEGPRERPVLIEGTPLSDTEQAVRELSAVVAHNAKMLNSLVGAPGDLLLLATK